MITLNGMIIPKAPRWISTEAGQLAWAADTEWRRVAERAFSVNERRRLLDQAERMREPLPAATATE